MILKAQARISSLREGDVVVNFEGKMKAMILNAQDVKTMLLIEFI